MSTNMRTERFLEISNEQLDNLFELLEVQEGEMTPEIEARLHELIDEGEAAIIDCVRQIQNLQASIETSKLWEKKRRERRKRKEIWVERIRSLVTEAMDKRGIKRLEDPESGDKVRTQESTRFEHADIDFLPDEFKREFTVVEPDKEKLKDYVKEFGELVDPSGRVVARFVKSKHCVIW